MNYNVILFDVDGLVITSERFSTRLEREYGTPWEAMRPFFEGPFVQCKLGKASLKEELQKVLPRWGWPGNAESLLEYWFDGDHVDQEVIHFVKGMQSKGVTCYLATNQTSERADYLLNDLQLGSLFDGIYNSAEMGCLKDDPVFFQKILDDQGIQGHHILFIDHDDENLEAARAAGVTAFHYTDLPTLKSFLKT